jgi:exopolyphosphatase / guanosine-5'-triphosphate,3'-diphosphate pyrophosphatase
VTDPGLGAGADPGHDPASPVAADQPGRRDLQILAGQLDRQPRDVNAVACRCPFGYPAVIETGPLLAGEPNPTLFYLTCPSAVKAVSQVESGGAVKRFKEACRDDAELRVMLEALNAIYRRRRDELRRGSGTSESERSAAPGDVTPETTAPSAAAPAVRREAGIGGPRSPEVATCLHAYGAAMMAAFVGRLGGEGRERDIADDLGVVWRRFLPPLEKCWCNDRACGRWDTGSKAAAIDVGTISVRLLVAEMEAGRPKTLVRRAEITRLGEGLQPGGPLGVAAKQRTALAVARFVAEARETGADSIIVAATSAARDAADGAEFVAAVGRENGVEAAVLTGDQEARRAYAGATLDVSGDAVVLDIGGGSTEVMRRAGLAGVAAVSLNLGASRTTERWLKTDPPGCAETAAAAQEAAAAFVALRAEFGVDPASGAPVTGKGATTLIGVAGTVTTLACLDAGLRTYDSDLLHLNTLTLGSVRRLVERLSSMTTGERAALPCVQAGRAPVLVGGALVLRAAMETLGYEQLTVSERDILDGLVMCGLEVRVPPEA